MCGIVGIYNHPEASKLAYLALYALQHRGQESSGIVSSENGRLIGHRSMGHVADIFTESALSKLTGPCAIGHVRYSTHGESDLKNAQPFIVNYASGPLSVAHNGNLVNAGRLRTAFESRGSIFQSTMDTEVIVHLIAASKAEKLLDRVKEALSQVVGAWSLVFLTGKQMIVARDPFGFRPLVLGKKGDTYVVASESCALDLLEAELIREVEPGEVIQFTPEGVHSSRVPLPVPSKKAFCIFEYVYFARPDSIVYDRDVYAIRKGFGRELALEHPVEADMVVPVPDSGVPAAIGYSEASGIPFEFGLIRNHYVGRTFIEPAQSIRDFGVKVKLNALKGMIQGKRVILVDDSLVRGTTSLKIIRMVRAAGAREVHVRISSPPVLWPCFYGIDTPLRKELVAANHSTDEIRRYIGADSLAYLSPDNLYWFQKQKEKGEWFCDACFTGNYPDGREYIEGRLTA